MALPLNISALIHGKTVEWERLEFKKGWNPEAAVHTICAFANDLHNWGGGYIVIGIAERNGRPILPPEGLEAEQVDAIQKRVLELAHKIQPNYFPVMQPFVLQNKHILVLWCPAGDHRMYTVPTSLSKDSTREPYVRIGSNTIVARGETLRQLMELTARIPFDDRINQQATVHDMDLGLIQAYLQEVKSDLYRESLSMTFEDLCRTMLIAKGSEEYFRPVNVGLLFFCRQPDRFFNRCQIEIVWHHDDSGRNFTEHYFKGPLHQQLREALSFVRSNIIAEQVVKRSDRAEADRFYNFPYEAVEEALANAVYHKSYELDSPIEVQIWTDKIEILSYPGPVPPVNAKILKTQRRIVSREYRNRRIGDFLKELHLTEGRGTGFPTIYKAMENNGSPAPVFETDTDSTFFLTILPAHLADRNPIGNGALVLIFNELDEIIDYGNGVGNGAHSEIGFPAIDIINRQVHERVLEMLEIMTVKIKRDDLFKKMGLSNQSKNRSHYLDPLIRLGWIIKEFPEEPNHPNQTYHITQSGGKILSLITEK
ncbi:MAG: putative DNA binding domain-containing protein [Bacteroidales bacterium]|nr:putative DNA binding domain-containing protein [Bacteroidales bacterium]